MPSPAISSNTRIDIIIPAIEKDLHTLPYVIDSLRTYVKHPIGEIMIIAPRRLRMLQLCTRKGCKFIDENTVLPITKKHINYRSKRWERSGWLFQQLLKFGGDSLGKADFFLVIDADTVLIRPHIFRKGRKTIFYCRNWSQPEYYRTYTKLMRKKAKSRLSFVTHYMLFEKTKLRQLKKTIEAKHQKSWYTAIINSINKKQQFGFSEFETYGNFHYTAYPHSWIQKKALNKGLTTPIAKLTPSRILTLARTFRSLSFHKRKGYVR